MNKKKETKTDEIRQTFLDYFHRKGHKQIIGSSLITHNDPTLLFTNAGMNQFKNVFLGLELPPYKRVTTSQLCIRAGGKDNDINNIGYSLSHHTLFEMLGNFSFGDYFKFEAIQFAWELLTSPQWFNLPSSKLWVTVYSTDNESYDIWTKKISIPKDHIIRIGDKKGKIYYSDNFWSMGNTGPCGPCSEIFYEHGDHILGSFPGNLETQESRYIEIWNLVFMQFNRIYDGTLQQLPKPSVDTGMGLERISAILHNVHNNYDIDIFNILKSTAAKILGIKDQKNRSLHIIVDHIRSSSFLISEGIFPSNEGRGYVLRRIIRRAIRHGNIIGYKKPFFYKLVEPLIEVMGSTADRLRLNRTIVEKIIRLEEEKFTKTLEHGLKRLNEELNKLTNDTLDGDILFLLYDSYGIPIDLTEEICYERNLKVDKIGFEHAMEIQRKRAKNSNFFISNYNENILYIDQSTNFVGYEKIEHYGEITGIFHHGKSVREINQQGEEAILILNETPFYSESGGQIGDSGQFETNLSKFLVENTKKYAKAICHYGRLIYGKFQLGEFVNAKVDPIRREKICLNHSATHLLHTTLRKVLGEDIKQKGSLVSDKYLRFDFSHNHPITLNQIRYLEEIINKQIRRNLLINDEFLDLKSAINKGAIALFNEKYNNERVRVLSIGNFSIELCIGTHVHRTGNIGLFHIITEYGISYGIRRIEAVTGEKALSILLHKNEDIHHITQLLKVKSKNIVQNVYELQERYDQLEKKYQQLKRKQAIQEGRLLLTNNIIQINDVKVLVKKTNNIDSNHLRIMVDDIKNQLGSSVIVLASVINKNVILIVGVTKNLTDRIKANEIIKNLSKTIGVKGGGRPDIAQAGGIDISKLPNMLTSIESLIKMELEYN